MPKHKTSDFRDWLQDLVLRCLIGAALALPYTWRVPLFGQVMRRVVAPIAGYRQRALNNLALIWPDLPAKRRREIADEVSENAGRTFIENYSGREFIARMAAIIPTGPGMVALELARQEGRPAILVSGHFGNYEAARACLVARGFDVGGLYRPARNSYFNDHYVRTMEAFGGPVFPQGHKGTSGFVRHLKAGGQLVLLFDQSVHGAEAIDFLGQPATTTTSAAQLALKYGALLIPFYATRLGDGISFAIELEAPVHFGSAKEMTAAISSSLEARIHQNPGQWFWVHRRWHIGRARRKNPSKSSR